MVGMNAGKPHVALDYEIIKVYNVKRHFNNVVSLPKANIAIQWKFISSTEGAGCHVIFHF